MQLDLSKNKIIVILAICIAVMVSALVFLPKIIKWENSTNQLQTSDTTVLDDGPIYVLGDSQEYDSTYSAKMNYLQERLRSDDRQILSLKRENRKLREDLREKSGVGITVGRDAGPFITVWESDTAFVREGGFFMYNDTLVYFDDSGTIKRYLPITP